VTATDSTTTPLDPEPSVSLDKQAGTPSGNEAGDTIDYSFVVTNTGNVTLDPIAVDDPTVGAVDCPVTVLAPGETTTCTATYTLTQADVDAGHVANTATVSGTPPTGADVTAVDNTDTPITAGPAILLDKVATGPTGNQAGDTITFDFAVTNTGNVTLDPVTVDDPMLGGVTCPTGALAPGDTVTCTAVTYTLTQADVDAGAVDNTATATGTPPTGADVTDDDSTHTVIAADPSITIDKQSGAPSDVVAGSTIDYTFVVTNTGNVTLDPISIDDPVVGPVDCTAGPLAPGDTVTCTATYTITQTDVNAGHVFNAATVSGTPPTGPDVTATDSTDTVIPAGPALSLAKQAGTPTGTAAGDTIDYTFVVTNTGNVSLDPVTVDDPMLGGPVSCPAGPVAPGDSITCGPVTYTISQADVDGGLVTNTATATGTPPTGPDVTDDDTTTTPLAAAPAIALDKQAAAPTGTAAGDSIDYTFTVTNTGNVTLDPVVVDDPTVGPVTCPAGPLAPGASVDCGPVTHVLTQADVDAGHVANTATATGTPPSGADVTATDSTDTLIDAGPALTLDKVAGVPTGDSAGSTIDYTFVVTNTGNVTLDPVAIDDPKVGAVSCPADVLAPGATMTCTATYLITQDDIDSGSIDNTATAYGNPPGGDVASTGDDASATDSTSTPIVATPSISLDKSAGAASGSTAGDTVPYTFEVTNTGNVTLDPISVDDPLIGAVDCPQTALAPGEVAICTATYTLTQADVDAGTVDNTATAYGNPPGGDPDVTTDDVSAVDSVSTPIPASPAIDLVKTGTADGVAVGDTIDYTFVVTNSGNVTLTDIVVDDPVVGLVACPATTLAPGDDMTCTAAYTITSTDVDAGLVHNVATVFGTPPTGTAVTATDQFDILITPAPAITLDKQASQVIDGDTNGVDPGDTIDYTFLVTNTGNVTLTGVLITDAIVAGISCPQTTLVAGEWMTCTATYTLTQADIDLGRVDNTASVSGTPPTGSPVTDSDSVRTPVAQTPAIDLVKDADVTGAVKQGDKVVYTFTVTNIGNVTLTRVRISDPKLGTITCDDRRLAPGESTTCRGPAYTVTAQDVERGTIRNHAVVRGDGGGGAEVSDDDAVVVQTATCTGGSAGCAAHQSILLDKKADSHGPVDVGDEIVYSFVVTNTGKVTLDHIKLKDPKLGDLTCPRTTLRPGESMTCHAAPYVVTAEDIADGSVVNHASTSGVYCPPAGACSRVTSHDTVTVPTGTSGGGLPNTGSPVEPRELLLALVMLMAGAGLVVAGRRRRT
jgi:uncharacterized repeat protein (TIGR01451 family)